jgi:hypothetical protein
MWLSALTAGWLSALTAGWLSALTAGWLSALTAGWLSALTAGVSGSNIYQWQYNRTLPRAKLGTQKTSCWRPLVPTGLERE